jgi:hypothetical protein
MLIDGGMTTCRGRPARWGVGIQPAPFWQERDLATVSEAAALQAAIPQI